MVRAAWERRSTESGPAFEAFRTYCELGPERSTRKVADQLNKHVSLIARWSSRHAWVRRAASWDARGAGQPTALESVGHGEVIEGLLRALGAPGFELLRRLEADPDLMATLSADQLLEQTQLSARQIGALARVDWAKPKVEGEHADPARTFIGAVLIL